MKFAIALCSAALITGCSDKTNAPARAAPPTRTAASPTPPAPAPAPANLLSAEAIGKIRFGDTLEQVEAALKEKATGPRTTDCVYVQFPSLPGVHVMVENKVVVRADIKPGVPNITGVNAGDDPALLKSKFPAATVSPHKYVEAGHDIRISGTGKTAMIFEDDGKAITSVRGGLEPAVSYVEGCS